MMATLRIFSRTIGFVMWLLASPKKETV
jgi:hypothetical protein